MNPERISSTWTGVVGKNTLFSSLPLCLYLSLPPLLYLLISQCLVYSHLLKVLYCTISRSFRISLISDQLFPNHCILLLEPQNSTVHLADVFQCFKYCTCGIEKTKGIDRWGECNCQRHMGEVRQVGCKLILLPLQLLSTVSYQLLCVFGTSWAANVLHSSVAYTLRLKYKLWYDYKKDIVFFYFWLFFRASTRTREKDVPLWHKRPLTLFSIHF